MAQQVGLFVLGAAFLAYLQGTVLYQLLLAVRRPRYGRWATVALLIGAAAHGAGLVARWVESGHLAFANAVDTLALYAWLTVLIYLGLERVLGQKALGAVVAPLGCVAILGAILLPVHEHPTLWPFARSVWLPLHVAVSFASYALLTVAFGSALLYLLQERQLKGRRASVLFGHLPSLGTLDRLTFRLIEGGFVLLTIAIVSGAFGAEAAWGSYWSWEPKETSALITWLIYLAYFHLRNVVGWSGRQTARWAVLGFGAVLATYLLVNLALPGLHNFGVVGTL